MLHNKKSLIAFSIAFLIVLSTLSSIILALVVSFNRKYSTDDELFYAAKDKSATVYFALDSVGSPYELWADTSTGEDEWCSFEDASEYLKLGFIAAEDRDFYRHHGINIRRSLMALINQVIHFKGKFGASTITQQVIKNISGDNEKSIRRKVSEIYRAMRLESVRSKDEIFELYMNIVPMSHNVYGVAGAAELYFGKEPLELSLAEAATIVGVTNSPARFNPISNPEAAITKRNNVLYAMKDCGFIDEEMYAEALGEPLLLNTEEKEKYHVGSWFVETAREDILADLSMKYSVSKQTAKLLLRGASVILTVDEKVQGILENYFENEENLPEAFKEGLNYCIAVTDNEIGDLVGIIGRAGKKKGNYLFNLATAPVTPASALKPIAIYAPLIDSGDINPSTVFDDVPLYYKEVNGGISAYPKNSPDIYDGDITLAEALNKSKNTVAIQLYEMLGPEKIYNILHNDYGFSNLSCRDKNPAPLALGQLTNGVSIRKLTEAYGVFPSGGVLKNARSYISVHSKDGELLLENTRHVKKVMSRDTAMIMTGLLSGVVEDGTAFGITLKNIVDTAGKTGTSSGDLDRLFIGFTPYYTAGIWCGYSDGRTPVGRNTPSHLEIWDNVMKEIHEACAFSSSENLKNFSYSGLLGVKLSKTTGERYCELCDKENCLFEYFRFTDLPKEHICYSQEKKRAVAG